MNNYLQILLNNIKLPENLKTYFENGSLEKIVFVEEEATYFFNIELPQTIPCSVYFELCECIKKFFINEEIKNIEINIEAKEKQYLNEYYKYFLDNTDDKSFFIEELKEIKIILNDNVLTLEVDSVLLSNKVEEIKNELLIFLEKCGFGKIIIDTRIVHNENNEVKELIEESLNISDLKIPDASTVTLNEKEAPKKNFQYERKPRVTEDKPNVIYGREIQDEVTIIKNINSENNNLTIEAFVFADVDVRETRKNNYFKNYRLYR